MKNNAVASIVVPALSLAVLAGVVTMQVGRKIRQPDPDPGPTEIRSPGGGETRRVSVTGLPKPLAVWETVFWEPRDTTSLRQLILGSSLVKDKTVLEIGTGSGLLSLCCLQAGAKRVLATDVNQFAIANAAYNADQFGWGDRLDLRLVSLDDMEAFAVIEDSERFDLIVSNPPWEDREATTIDTYALYDKDFRLLKSLLSDCRDHLQPEGRMLLAYGCVSAIRALRQLAEEHQLEVRVLDERNLDELPEVFLPGMLLELRPQDVGNEGRGMRTEE